jgi:hypothetical protein
LVNDWPGFFGRAFYAILYVWVNGYIG